MSFLIEFFLFLKVRKKYWMIPMLLFIFLFGFIVVISEGSAVAPLIYTLF